MIYTVTFNPAVDLVVHCDRLNSGEVNRSRSEKIFFGGKGINVSLVLAQLGVHSAALGFTAGFTGAAIEEAVKAAGVETDFVRLADGFSRINVKIKSDSETELNCQGPRISDSALNELFARLDRLADGDSLVLAGSVPKSLPDNIYEEILKRLQGKDITVYVDASGKLLLNVLKYKPFLIKPNADELGEIFGVKIEDKKAAARYAEKLIEKGAKNVLVSMAGTGAVLVCGDCGIYECEACGGTVKNSVGAGDSMLAGVIAGALENNPEYALRLGTAAGGATAFSEGLAKRDDIFALLESIS